MKIYLCLPEVKCWPTWDEFLEEGVLNELSRDAK